MASNSSSFEFDRATAVVRRENSAGDHDPSVPGIGESVMFDADIHDGWDISGNANGGYILAIVGRALSQALQRPDCVTVTCHYLAPCPAGPVVIEVRPIRVGRRFATATATMWREIDGRRTDIVQVLATMGDLTGQGGVTSMAGEAPTLPDLDDCPRLGGTSISEFAHLHGRLATRGHPDDIGFRNGQRSGRGMMRGWFAFADDRPIDSVALLLASDAFPPAVFNLDVAAAWVPTVELTVHVRSRPAPGPIRCVFETRFLQNGLLEEDGEMWDSHGVLVAQSRQLALAPRSE